MWEKILPSLFHITRGAVVSIRYRLFSFRRYLGTCFLGRKLCPMKETQKKDRCGTLCDSKYIYSNPQGDKKASAYGSVRRLIIPHRRLPFAPLFMHACMQCVSERVCVHFFPQHEAVLLTTPLSSPWRRGASFGFGHE